MTELQTRVSVTEKLASRHQTRNTYESSTHNSRQGAETIDWKICFLDTYHLRSGFHFSNELRRLHICYSPGWWLSNFWLAQYLKFTPVIYLGEE